MQTDLYASQDVSEPKVFTFDKENHQMKFYFEENVILNLSSFELYVETNKSLYSNVRCNRLPERYLHPVNTFEYMKGTYFLLTYKASFSNTSHFLCQLFAGILLAKKYCKDFEHITFIVDKIPEHYRSLITLLGKCNLIEIERVKNKALIFERAVFTNETLKHNISREVASVYSDFTNSLLLPKNYNNKIYISRKDSPMRSLINEDAVIAYMKKRNYEILELSKMPVLEQIGAFTHATNVVGSHGAGGANLVFSSDEITFIETFVSTHVNPCHAVIAYVKNCYYGATLKNNILDPVYKNLPPNGSFQSYAIDINLLDQVIETPLIKFEDFQENIYEMEPFDIETVFQNKLRILSPEKIQKREENKIQLSENIYEFGINSCLEVLEKQKLSAFYYYKSLYYSEKKDDTNAMYFATLAYNEEDCTLYSIHLINLLLKKKEYQAIDNVLAESLGKNLYIDKLYTHVSYLYEKERGLLVAIDYAKKLLEIMPNNPNAIILLANLLRKNGDFDLIIELMTGAHKFLPQWSEPQAQFAMIYEAQGELDKALECAKKALEIEPQNRMHKILLANLLRKNGDFDLVIELMTEAQKLLPQWSEPQAQFAMIYEAKGELDKALECAKKALEIVPLNTLRQSYLVELSDKISALCKNRR